MLAPPGAGKGTQGERIAARYGVPHISSGEIFRDETARQTPLGKQLSGYLDRGDLVPDDLVLSLIKDRVVAAAKESGGYVLDGFPRNLAQAEAAAEHRPGDAARARRPSCTWTRRRTCSSAASPAAARTARTTRKRSRGTALRCTREHTQPLVDYFAARGILVKIDAAAPVDAVSQQIFSALDRIKD